LRPRLGVDRCHLLGEYCLHVLLVKLSLVPIQRFDEVIVLRFIVKIESSMCKAKTDCIRGSFVARRFD
jgi:hypothetical protein